MNSRIKKENLSQLEYEEAFGPKPLKEYSSISVEPKSRWEKAYERACDTRKFEIDLYWKRATYFWAFITTIYVAYYHVLVYVYDKEYDHFPLLILSGLGLFFAIAWILITKGSRHWQENWERHVSLLEDPVTGPLFKIRESNSFSVSKVNLSAGYVVATCAAGLYVFELGEIAAKMSFEFGVNSFLFFMGVFALSVLGVVSFIVMSRGCKKKDGSFELDQIEFG